MLPPAVAMRGMVKHYGSVVALAGADLDVAPGEVHAVVGENGAGKTTLMHILAGLVTPDAGEVAVAGRRVRIGGVEAAHALGIGMVHQHFMLFPSLTVAQNLTIGREPLRGGLIDARAARRAVRGVAERYGLQVDPDARISSLSVGDLQRVEILRSLFWGAQILILDEPTAVLTPQEAQSLFRIIRDLTADGKTTIFISHKLDEVMQIADGITVLRDGSVTGALRTSDASVAGLARLMVGRDVFGQFERTPSAPGEPVLELTDVRAAGIDGVSLTVRRGEIVGVAGVAGNGQTELADTIAGLIPLVSGSVRIAAQDVARQSPAARRRAGMAYIPEDRYRRGLALEASVADNLVMGSQHRQPLAERGLLSRIGVRKRADALIERFQIRGGRSDTPARNLSGGNAQKCVVARELAEPAALVVASQPTRGIDVASTEFVRSELLRCRSAGAGVLLISAELAELMSIADRIVVMFGGRIVGEARGDQATEAELGLWMAGVRAKEPAVA